MSNSCYHRCYLCASDEGVFLDIFAATQQNGNDRLLADELENCLGVKVNERDSVSSELCHKCAFELGQCNDFLDRYWNVRRSSKYSIRLQTRCCLCQADATERHLFGLAQEFQSAIVPTEKIEKCLDNKLSHKDAKRRKICLSCRYSLDLLFDLKNLASQVLTKPEVIANDAPTIATLPKTETLVVIRKTTRVGHKNVKVQTPCNSESESNTMACSRLRSKNVNEATKSTLKTSTRICDECHTAVEDGIDMYRMHTTGVTVCKMCWITMDPVKTKKGRKRKLFTDPDSRRTKLCAVFLRDVLGTTFAKYDKGNDSSQVSDAKSDQGSDGARNVGGSKRRVNKRVTDVEPESRPKKKLKVASKRSNDERDAAASEKIFSVEISQRDSTDSETSSIRTNVKGRRVSKKSRVSDNTEKLKSSSAKNSKVLSASSVPSVDKSKRESLASTITGESPSSTKITRTSVKYGKPRGSAAKTRGDPYECTVCKTSFENKLLGMKHELTHFKQLEIKIEKFVSKRNTEDDAEAELAAVRSSPDTSEKRERGVHETPGRVIGSRLVSTEGVEATKPVARSQTSASQNSVSRQRKERSRAREIRSKGSDEVNATEKSDQDSRKEDATMRADEEVKSDRTETTVDKDEGEERTRVGLDDEIEKRAKVSEEIRSSDVVAVENKSATNDAKTTLEEMKSDALGNEAEIEMENPIEGQDESRDENDRVTETSEAPIEGIDDKLNGEGVEKLIEDESATRQSTGIGEIVDERAVTIDETVNEAENENEAKPEGGENCDGRSDATTDVASPKEDSMQCEPTSGPGDSVEEEHGDDFSLRLTSSVELEDSGHANESAIAVEGDPPSPKISRENATDERDTGKLTRVEEEMTTTTTTIPEGDDEIELTVDNDRTAMSREDVDDNERKCNGEASNEIRESDAGMKIDEEKEKREVEDVEGETKKPVEEREDREEKRGKEEKDEEIRANDTEKDEKREELANGNNETSLTGGVEDARQRSGSLDDTDKNEKEMHGEEKSLSLLAATDALQEVINLAAAEVQKRADNTSMLAETLEDISKEVNNAPDEPES